MSIFKPIYSPLNSLFVLLLILCFYWGYRLKNVDKKEVSWDVFGYYLPILGAFEYDDPLLNDRKWVDDLNQREQFSDTVYQVSSNDQGEPMYFFLFGMSFFYSIFYFLGDGCAAIFGFARDGLSPPYQYALVVGNLVYFSIGLFLFRKILKTYFKESTVVVLLVLVFIGTNAIHHLTLKNLETVNVLFFLMTFLVWNTLLFYQNYKSTHLFLIFLTVGLMALVKPSEILMLSIPFFWKVGSWNALKERLFLLFKLRWKILIGFGVIIILFIPQMTYWYYKTGHILYDTYKNPGVGLDVFQPHVLDSLFSYRKGWLVYTPIMIFALVGFVPLIKQNKALGLGILWPFLIGFYVIASWSEWWYGAGFSNRPVIVWYLILAIPLGYFIESVQSKSKLFQLIVHLGFTVLIVLNVFQWWQLKNYILDPYRTTKDYYWAIFGKTQVSEEDKSKMLVYRSFSGENQFVNRENYTSKKVLLKHHIVSKNVEEFPFSYQKTYAHFTVKDHLWIEVNVVYSYSSIAEGEQVLIPLMMHRKEGAYGYKAFNLAPTNGGVKDITFVYLTPELRSRNDELKMDIWKRIPVDLEVKTLKMTIFEPK